jgi:hypothetical protein
MRNLIRIVTLLALLEVRATFARAIGGAGSSAGSATATAASLLTQNTRLVGGAPEGRRQPDARDLPSDAGNLERVGEEDVAVDRELNICRSC